MLTIRDFMWLAYTDRLITQTTQPLFSTNGVVSSKIQNQTGRTSLSASIRLQVQRRSLTARPPMARTLAWLLFSLDRTKITACFVEKTMTHRVHDLSRYQIATWPLTRWWVCTLIESCRKEFFFLAPPIVFIQLTHVGWSTTSAKAKAKCHCKCSLVSNSTE